MAVFQEAFECVNVTTVLIGLCVVLVSYCLWPVIKQDLSYLPGPPCYPLIGTLLPVFRKGFGCADLEGLKKYGKVYRTYLGMTPSIVVGDVDILKHVLVKDFPIFTDRRVLLSRGKFEYSLFHAGGSRWRRLRNLMTPAFTSKKLKNMNPIIDKCVEKILRNVGDACGNAEGFDAKRVTGAFTMDVIASTSFGLDIDSQRDLDNPFVLHASKFITRIVSRNPKLYIPMLFPFTIKILNLFGVTMADPAVFDFFEKFVNKTIADRRKSIEEHHDLMQTMLNAHNEELDDEGKADLFGHVEISEEEKKKGMSSFDIIAQSVIFLVAGFESTSNTMAFMMYSLAENPDVQDKLYQEITEVKQSEEGLTLENISKMAYLDQCIQETLRMYPPAIRVNRKASRDIKIKNIHIPAGTGVVIPIYALHHDPDVWTDPSKYDPDRFSPEARAARSPYSHLPFGMGPRMCIGMRLAMMEIKMAFVQLISTYRLLPSGKPLQLDFHLIARGLGGIWVKAERR